MEGLFDTFDDLACYALAEGRTMFAAVGTQPQDVAVTAHVKDGRLTVEVADRRIGTLVVACCSAPPNGRAGDAYARTLRDALVAAWVPA